MKFKLDLAGFEGQHCDIDIDECLNTPCLNGGSCSNSVGSYACDCEMGKWIELQKGGGWKGL